MVNGNVAGAKRTAHSKLNRGTKADMVFDVINITILGIWLLIVAYPLYFIVIASISDPVAVNSGEVILLPKNITFKGYEEILKESSIWRAYLNTIVYTTVGTFLNVLFTLGAAYPLSKKDLVGRNLVMVIVTITMFFGGGLIPTFILINNLKMYNTMWALVLPGLVSPYNLILARTFFQSSIPDSICEAAYIDGASHFQTYFRIVLPVSKALIAIMILYYGIGHWNSYYSALIYISDQDKYPLQMILRKILILNQMQGDIGSGELMTEKQHIADLVKYCAMIVSSIPMLIAYPFIQKHFTKGVMLGAIKG